MLVSAILALRLIPADLESQPLFLCIDDTMVSKFGEKFEAASKLFDHAAHNGSPEFHGRKNVILLCDSWYVKQNPVSIIDEYENLDLTGNARADSVLYDLPPAPTGKKGRPAKHGRRLSIDSGFTLSREKAGDYYTGCRLVLTNIFGTREVMAYVTSSGKLVSLYVIFDSHLFVVR